LIIGIEIFNFWTMNDTLFSIKTFNYVISKPGFQQTISYDFQIPLAENSLGSDFFGHLFAKHKVPLFACEGKLNYFNLIFFNF